jgi:hypothetical protein
MQSASILKHGEKSKDDRPHENQLLPYDQVLSALVSIIIPTDELMTCTNFDHGLNLSKGWNRRRALHRNQTFMGIPSASPELTVFPVFLIVANTVS